jgi:uncharacterized protein (TIGR03089 family)
VSTSPPTFPALLIAQLRTDAARPLVTFYDDATGERIELSVTTFANWVSKTASLLQDELEVERGARVLVDLPTHWLGPVWLGAAWTLGLQLSDRPADERAADLVVCGPEGVERYAEQATRVPVLALSLRPLGGRFAEPLPTGVIDFGAVVLAQPDAFTAYDPPAGDDVAWSADGSSQARLLADAVADDLVARSGRLITDVNPCTRDGLRTLLAPLAHGAGTVWVRNPDESAWSRKAEAERATASLRACQSPRS